MSGEDVQREILHRALQRHMNRDIHFTAAYTTLFVARVVPIELLAELVDGLNKARPVRWTDTGSGPGVEDHR